MEASTWANFLSILALAGTGLGIFWNRRDVAASKRDSAKAEARADAAAALAERATAAQERAARALELQLIAIARGEQEAHPAWQLTWTSGETYTLENVGRATAYDVTIEPTGRHVIFNVRDEAASFESIKPGESVRFLMALTMASTDDSIRVGWSDAPGRKAAGEWRRSLPPKR